LEVFEDEVFEKKKGERQTEEREKSFENYYLKKI